LASTRALPRTQVTGRAMIRRHAYDLKIAVDTGRA
jgi:hypothetical protein